VLAIAYPHWDIWTQNWPVGTWKGDKKGDRGTKVNIKNDLKVDNMCIVLRKQLQDQPLQGNNDLIKGHCWVIVATVMLLTTAQRNGAFSVVHLRQQY
jgi:hypothetical protein